MARAFGCSGCPSAGNKGQATEVGVSVRTVDVAGGAQVAQDLVSHLRLSDHCDDPHRAAALRAQQRVDLVDAAEEVGPAASGVRERGVLLTVFAVGL